MLNSWSRPAPAGGRVHAREARTAWHHGDRLPGQVALPTHGADASLTAHGRGVKFIEATTYQGSGSPNALRGKRTVELRARSTGIETNVRASRSPLATSASSFAFRTSIAS